MDAKEFFSKIDWSELRNQKTTLLETIEAEKGGFEEMIKNLDGIVHLIDALQDYAVDELGINENHVFDMDVEEQRENETPEEFFARDCADTIYTMAVESEALYFDLPDGMTKEFVNSVVNDEFHANIMKGNIRSAILKDVCGINSDSFHRDSDGKLAYDYQIFEDYGGEPDVYVRKFFYKNKVKTLYLCPHCMSDNIDVKAWVNANTRALSDSECPTEGEDCYCNDCDKHGMVELIQIPFLSELIGFRVVSIDNENIYHPSLTTGHEPLICNLHQARGMIGDTNKDGDFVWKLKAVWDDEVCDDLMIFGTDPRG